MSKVLIIDDDPGVCRTLTAMVRQQGHEVRCAATLAEGVAAVTGEVCDIVLLDVHLPDGNGLDTLHRFCRTACSPDVVIMTAQGDPDGAELALRSGAWDYIDKATSPAAISKRLKRIFEHRHNRTGAARSDRLDRTGIVGNSRPLAQALELMARTIHSDAGVLITGETGTGKELFAQAVHHNSTRRDGNFVVVDCAALPKTLVEAMLFGHVKGAFTSAEGAREGLIAQADGGTLFLDEVGEMPLDVQKSFLRVLESKRFRPIGGKNEHRSNFRIIASTNQNLEDMVRQGTFRKDLLYRLRAFHLTLPALRYRKEDIADIVHYHLDRLNRLYDWPPREVSEEFFNLLQNYDWPGNVRELVNALEHALSAAKHDNALYEDHLPMHLRIQAVRQRVSQSPSGPASDRVHHKWQGAFPQLQSFREKAVEEAETQYLDALMSTAQGDIAKACSLSGVSRSRLYELLKKHAIRYG